MRWLRFAGVLVAAAVLQAAGFTDMASLSPLGIRPDLLVIVLVFFTIYYEGTDAITAAFLTGLAADIIMIGSAMGPRMVSFGVVGTALAYLHRFISIRRMPYQAIAIFIASLLAGAISQVLTLIVHRAAAAGAAAGLAWTSAYSAVVGPFLFIPLRWFMQPGVRAARRR